MLDKAFLDSNFLIYLHLEDDNNKRTDTAQGALRHGDDYDCRHPILAASTESARF